MGITSNIKSEQEQIGTRSSDGNVRRGMHAQVIKEAVAARTLLQKESGATCVFDLATGTTFTLPPPAVGMEFEFDVQVSVTSNAHKIITDAATTFLNGAVLMGSIATASPAGFSADGSTIRALSANGSTTGGLKGERYKVKCISSTVWQISGICVGSGTLATPFATS